MKKLFTLAVVLIGTFGLSAQSQESKSWGFGFHLNEWGNDFGVGGSISSPEYFGFLTFDLAYSGQFRSSIVLDGEAWRPYGVIDFGVRSKGGQITPWFSLYGFGRINFLTHAAGSGWETPKVSGSGGFGFEFNTSGDGLSPVSYFIELGGRGGFQNVHPDHISVAGGFNTSVGFRFCF